MSLPAPKFVDLHVGMLVGRGFGLLLRIMFAEHDLAVTVKRQGLQHHVEALAVLVQDVGGIPAVMVSTSHFSLGAQNHLAAEGIGHITITLKDAEALRWIPLLEEKFAVDRAFRYASGHLFESLREGKAEPFLDTDIPFEEWLAVMRCGQDIFPEPTCKVLKCLARKHFDDGVRYNAVTLLAEAGELTSDDFDAFIEREPDLDPDIVEYLRGCVMEGE